jgi:hypothetical protein
MTLEPKFMGIICIKNTKIKTGNAFSSSKLRDYLYTLKKKTNDIY